MQKPLSIPIHDRPMFLMIATASTIVGIFILSLVALSLPFADKKQGSVNSVVAIPTVRTQAIIPAESIPPFQTEAPLTADGNGFYQIETRGVVAARLP